MVNCWPGGIGTGDDGVTQSIVTSLRRTVSTSTALKKATDWEAPHTSARRRALVRAPFQAQHKRAEIGRDRVPGAGP